MWCTQTTKTPTGTEQTRTQLHFFRSETILLNSCRSLDYARCNEYIIYFADLRKPIETYIYARKKAPICKLSRSKAPKTQQIYLYRHTRKTSELLLLFNTGVDLVSAIILLTQVPLQVSVPVHNYNSLIKAIREG